MEHGSRTRLATAAILAVVFGAGVILGLAVDSAVAARPSDAVATDQRRQEPDSQRSERRPIYAQVNPTEAQQVRIDSIIGERRERMRELNDEFRPRFDELEGAYGLRRGAIVQDTRESILGVLTADQAAEYRRLLDEWDRRQAERRDRDK
jgi:hypothetical protein